MKIEDLLRDEALRRATFPVTEAGIFLAHAAVAPLPAVAGEALCDFARAATRTDQQSDRMLALVAHARASAARLLGCGPDEVALLGPTALGLSLVAEGWPWQPGDEIVYYADDYPANVYPWTGLADRGVKPVALRTAALGVITWADLAPLLTPRTRMVALASCNFVSGYRVDLADIGRRLHERGILLCVDGIQTLGAFPLPLEHVDFVSADAHKWLLGPVGAGVVYVKRSHHERLRPVLRGAWNVVSPGFIAQERIAYEPGARRYEPGSLNLPGIVAMTASIDLLLDLGLEAIGRRILHLRRALLERLVPLGFRPVLDTRHPEPVLSGILTLWHPDRDLRATHGQLKAAGVSCSRRTDRSGRPLLRFAPHAYNTEAELDHVASLLAAPA